MNYKKIQGSRRVKGLDRKLLDIEAVLAAVQQTKAIMTVEERSIIGGLGSAVAEVLAEMGGGFPLFRRLSAGDSFLQVMGGQEYLRQACGLSTEAICKAVQAIAQ